MSRQPSAGASDLNQNNGWNIWPESGIIFDLEVVWGFILFIKESIMIDNRKEPRPQDTRLERDNSIISRFELRIVNLAIKHWYFWIRNGPRVIKCNQPEPRKNFLAVFVSHEYGDELAHNLADLRVRLNQLARGVGVHVISTQLVGMWRETSLRSRPAMHNPSAQQTTVLGIVALSDQGRRRVVAACGCPKLGRDL